MQGFSGSKTIVMSLVAQNRNEGDMEGSGTGAMEAGVILLEAELPWWLRPSPVQPLLVGGQGATS